MTTPDRTAPAPMIWHSLRYTDAPAAIEYLTTVFGFEVVASFANPDDASIIEHAQLRWPEGGGIMLGTQRESPDWPATTGHAAAYVVTDHAGAVHQRAVDAGFRILQKLSGDPYDESPGRGQSFGCADPEGNLWSFGSYRGEAG